MGNFGAMQLIKHSVDQGYNSSQAMNASAGTILELTKMECQQCKDVPRLCAAVSLLCQLISCARPESSSALQSLLALMVNRYPKVRCCLVLCYSLLHFTDLRSLCKLCLLCCTKHFELHMISEQQQPKDGAQTQLIMTGTETS